MVLKKIGINMTNYLESDRSIFIGNWEKENFENGKSRLSRLVEIGGKEYKISVAYSDNLAKHFESPELPIDDTIKKVIEESEQQISKLIESFQDEADPIEKVTVKTNIRERTGSVAVKVFNKPNEKLSLPQLKDRNIKMESAASGLINRVSERCLYTSYSSRLSSPLKPVNETVREQVPEELNPFKRKAGTQLESLLKMIEGKESPKANVHGVKISDRFYYEGLPVELKEFEEGAYNGPIMEDYRRRQLLVVKAAIAFVMENAENIENLESVSTALSHLDTEFQKALQEPEYQLDYSLMKKGIEATVHLEEINRKQVELIGQFTRNAQHIINSALTSGECNISDLDKHEREQVYSRGRPIIVNIFNLNGQKFFSMQTPETRDSEGNRKKTIPSSLRDRQGLANYVSTSFGTISDEGRVSVEHYAIRHSSYSPIAVKDPVLRQGYAIQNLKQLMADLTESLTENESQGLSSDDPIIIPLRTMMLLTPLVGDGLRNRSKGVTGAWTGESEVLQLKESAFTLSTMRDRAVPIRVKGKTVWVKLDSSFMNLGANKEAARVGLMGKLPISSFENEINHRGYFEFVRDVESHLNKQELSSEVKNLFTQIRKLERHSYSYRTKVKELNSLLEQTGEDLKEKYRSLDELYARYESTRDPQLIKEIRVLKKEVMKRESLINKKFGELYQLRMNAIHRNGEKINELESRILVLMNEEVLHASDTAEEKEKLLVRDLFVNYFQAKQIYQTKAYRQPETVMEFQSLYIQTYEMMDVLVEFFCKSAEDRTGRVDNKVQERGVFRQLNQRQKTRSEADREIVDHLIAPAVHQYSASRDNTLWNSDSPGLQITHHVNPSVPATIDKMQATMAKKVMKKAKELGPTVQYNPQIEGIFIEAVS